MTAIPAAGKSTLEEGRQAYVALDSRDGPHVTPDLYALVGNEVWLAVASTTLKARLAATQPAASVVVSVPGRSVLLQGRLDVIDPRSWRRSVEHLVGLSHILRALGKYTLRNAPDLFSFLGDTVTGKLGRGFPPFRLALRFTVERGVIVEGGQVTERFGSWPNQPNPTVANSVAPVGGEPAVVAFRGGRAAPCRWYEDDHCAFVAPDVLALLDLDPSFPVGVVVDEYTAAGPAAKEGTLKRGTAHLATDPGRIDCDLEREVTWSGVDITSAPVRPIPA